MNESHAPPLFAELTLFYCLFFEKSVRRKPSLLEFNLKNDSQFSHIWTGVSKSRSSCTLNIF